MKIINTAQSMLLNYIFIPKFLNMIILSKFFVFFTILYSLPFFGPAVSTAASVVEPEDIGLVAETTRDGKVLIEDHKHLYKLTLPAPYWDYKAPRQTEDDQPAGGGGCAQRRAMPTDLLIVINNKDAPTTGITFEKLGRSFLLRGEEDLDKFMEKQETSLRAQLQDKGEITHMDIQQKNGMRTCTTSYSFRDVENDRNLYVTLVNFLIRPEGEEITVYQLQAFAPENWHGLIEDDFETIIDNFEYTGELAAKFFSPDAPEEKLPFPQNEESDTAGPVWGGGYSGIFLAIIVAFFAYMIYKKKKNA